jgi:hypothetical protein
VKLFNYVLVLHEIYTEMQFKGYTNEK